MLKKGMVKVTHTAAREAKPVRNAIEQHTVKTTLEITSFVKTHSHASHTHARTHARTYARTHTLTYTHTLTHNIHTHARTHIHTHSHTYTHTDTHTH